jgi:filamentous hemagglutinin
MRDRVKSEEVKPNLGGVVLGVIALIASDIPTANSPDEEGIKEGTPHSKSIVPMDVGLELLKENTPESMHNIIDGAAMIVSPVKSVKQIVDGISDGLGIVAKKGDVVSDGLKKIDGNVPVKNADGNVDSPRDELTGPYDPNTTRADLEASHGADNVTSTTNPNNPMQTVNSNPDKGFEVINGADGSKAVRVQFNDPVTGQSKTANIPYNNRDLPIFDDHVKYTTNIDHSLNYKGQMRQATRDLREGISNGRVDKNKFTPQQLNQIKSGSSTIKDFTWHHNADSGNMQLIPKNVHDAVRHIGQGSLSQGK